MTKLFKKGDVRRILNNFYFVCVLRKEYFWNRLIAGVKDARDCSTKESKESFKTSEDSPLYFIMHFVVTRLI